MLPGAVLRFLIDDESFMPLMRLQVLIKPGEELLAVCNVCWDLRTHGWTCRPISSNKATESRLQQDKPERFRREDQPHTTLRLRQAALLSVTQRTVVLGRWIQE